MVLAFGMTSETFIGESNPTCEADVLLSAQITSRSSRTSLM